MAAADWIVGVSLYFLGEYAEALTYARRDQRRTTPTVQRTHLARSGMNYSILARSLVVEILWQQGLLDQSAQTIRDLLADAQAGGHTASLCQTLSMISLRLGDLETADRSTVLLKDHAGKHGLSSYYACGLGFEGQLSAKRGDLAAAERLLRACLDGLHRTQYENLYTPFLSSLGEVLAAAGQFDESLAVTAEALQRTERNDAFWWMPEALRIKGDVMLLSHKADSTAAEDHFRRSLELARRQGALSWELRTAMSLAQLQRDQGRIGAARDLLAALYGRLTEGFGTADLRTAKQLLDNLTDTTSG